MSSVTFDSVDIDTFDTIATPIPSLPTWDFGSKLQEFGLLLTQPMHWSSEYVTRVLVYPNEPGKYGNLDTKWAETARRVTTMALHILLSPLTLITYFLGGAIQAMGEIIASKPYYSIEGTPQPWSLDQTSLMTFNTCMYWGGLPYHGGGLPPAHERMDQLETLIRAKNPDILVLQEMSFGPGLDLAERIKDSYAHLYTNIGAPHYRTTFYTAGPELFVASKAPVISEPRFIPYKLDSDKIGYFCIETPTHWIINAHFPDGKEEMWEHRRELLAQIHETMRSFNKPSILMGDLNVRRTGEPGDEYSKSGIKDLFYDPCIQTFPTFSEETATCTNEFLNWRLKPGDPRFEIDDHILLDKDSLDRVSVELGTEAYSISDHRYFFATVEKG